MGIGPRRAGILKEEAGIETVEDLLYYIPRRYVDRSSFRSIRDCFVNETVSVSGRITDVKVSGGARKRLEVFIDDGSDTLAGVFFAGVQYFSRIFQEGETVIFAGKIGVFRHKQIVHPDFDFIDDDSRISSINTGRIVPLYRSTEKLKSQGFDSRGFRRVIRTAIDDHLSSVCDNIPGDVIGRYGFLSLSGALRAIHFPDTFQEAESARRRLAFNEIFFLLFYLSLSRQYMKLRHGGKAISTDTGLCDDFIRSLPFALTGDQSRAIEEIKRDILSPFPMNRLLQEMWAQGRQWWPWPRIMNIA
jgi:ATP-dependent DNA helicase RecG